MEFEAVKSFKISLFELEIKKTSKNAHVNIYAKSKHIRKFFSISIAGTRWIIILKKGGTKSCDTVS